MANATNWPAINDRATDKLSGSSARTLTVDEVRKGRVVINASAGAITVTLPSASARTDGAYLIVCNTTGGTSSSNDVTVSTASGDSGFGQGKGSFDASVVGEGEFGTYTSDGTYWYALSATPPA